MFPYLITSGWGPPHPSHWGGSRYTETPVGTDNLERRVLDDRTLRGYPGYC
eukprot:COSAG02_NODE_9_length_59728_cov_36.104714_42_plen_51_part_00